MKHSSIKIHPIPSDGSGQPIEKEVGQLSLDIFSHENEIVILAPIAGIHKDDIKIAVTDDVLVIKGTRKARYNKKEEDYYTRECFWGSFSRSIILPLEADAKQINATFENNVLEIHIPKSEKQRTQVIKIKS